MALPDRVERTVTLTRGPREVWQALTTGEGLGPWFGGRAGVGWRWAGGARAASPRRGGLDTPYACGPVFSG